MSQNQQNQPLPDPPESHLTDDGWEECKSGTIQAIVYCLHRRRCRQKMMVKAGAAAVTCMLLVAVTMFAIPGEGDQKHFAAGISCSEVIQRAEDYMAGQLTELLHSQIDEHLADCEMCRKRYEQMRQHQKTNALAPPILQNEGEEPYSISHRRNGAKRRSQLVIGQLALAD